jgi:glycosyltransferase involved in cell wall biosynthesis
MLISLIHPSRGRPEKAYSNYINWMHKSSGGGVEHILSLDSDDKTLKDYRRLFDKYIVNDNTCVVEATNHAAKKAKGDILIYLSDDFDCPNEWDLKIINKVKGKTKFLLKVDDCLQKFSVPVLTIPIMSRQLYQDLDYFWHPDYKSMFCDCDLFETCKPWMINAPELKFPHLHPANGKAENDDTYKRSSAHWDQGKAVFKRRKALKFPI